MNTRPISYVYLAARSDGFLKVGISLTPSRRIVTFTRTRPGCKSPDVGSGQKVSVALLRTAIGGRREESDAHKTLRPFLVAGCNEWFHDTPRSRQLADSALRLIGPDMRASEEQLVSRSIRISRSTMKAMRIECLEQGISIHSFVKTALQEYFADTAMRSGDSPSTDHCLIPANVQG